MMNFDINDNTHWNQVHQGIKRNIQYPSKAAQYLIAFMDQVRECIAGMPVATSENSQSLEEVVATEFDKRVDDIVAAVLAQVRKEIQTSAGESAAPAEPTDSKITDEELEELTAPEETEEDEFDL